MRPMGVGEKAVSAVVIEGDCVEAMAAMPECSVDAVVCDPPYHLGFMGRAWDRAPTGAESQAMHAAWAGEALRVLKPGGHLLAFGGTRTFHRLACAVEDAGFEIRDCLSWLYGSGFPKSLDVSKAIDKAAGAEREVVGTQRLSGRAAQSTQEKGGTMTAGTPPSVGAVRDIDLTTPATPDAERWQGWGTALKPAWEPIIVARKPLVGTVAGNVLAHGTGALNVDGCRIGAAERPIMERTGTVVAANAMAGESTGATSSGETTTLGRWPANVALGHTDDCQMVGESRIKPVGATAHRAEHGKGRILNRGDGVAAHPGFRDADGLETVEAWECAEDCPVRILDEQSGGASRFFYTAKASRAERNAGLDGFEVKPIQWSSGDQNPGSFQSEGTVKEARNAHPTVKPIDLMRWLVRLVTPPGGTVLDPFLGSGTTGCAAVLEGFGFIGCERDADYVRIARARIEYWRECPPELSAREGIAMRRKVQAKAEAATESGQVSLL